MSPLLHSAMPEAARDDALDNFNKDVLYRKWAAMHGGVNVPVTAFTPPSLNMPAKSNCLMRTERTGEVYANL